MARSTVIPKTPKHHQRLRAKDLKRDPMRDAYTRLSEWTESNRDAVKRIGLGALAVLVVGGLIYYFTAYRTSSAQNAFAAAYEIYTAPVGDNNLTKAPVFFPTDEAKYRRAAEAFENVANSYSGSYGETARYFAGVSQLKFDPAKGKATLEALSRDNSATGRLAAFALAEQHKEEAQFAKAIELYRGLMRQGGELPASVLKLHLADALRLQGTRDEASNLYFEIASDGRKAAAAAAAAKAKDPTAKAEGDATPAVTREAVRRLTELDPAKVEQLPAEPPANPFGGFSFPQS